MGVSNKKNKPKNNKVKSKTIDNLTLDTLDTIDTIDTINKRIDDEICYETILSLTDEKLLEKYKEAKSVKKNVVILKEVLEKNGISNDIQEKIVEDFIIKLIPAGTKGVTRGNQFNEIIKTHLISFDLPKERFEIKFEKNHELYITDEKPDWYIYDKEKKKILIGMNQLDLWGGGQQFNRGSKYLIDNKHNTNKSKLLCVVCNKTNIKNIKNKTYKLFDIGFRNNTLCYIKGLEKIINNYFNL
jgi:hypothetical protein